MKSIFYISVDCRFGLSVLHALQNKGVHPAFIAVSAEMLNKEEFKQSTVFDHDKLNCPEFYENKTNMCLSEEILNIFSETERTFLKISDRFCLFSLSVRSRLNIYYDMLSFWLNFFEKNKLDAVYFNSTPHMGWDNVLHDVAKYLNIQTFHLERTGINDYVVLVDDYKDRGKVPEDYLEGKSIEELMEIVGKDLLIKASEQSYWSPPPGVCK